MRIGIIGIRGIPNQHGGYEQFVEFAAPELVLRGHEVYVYNSTLHPYREKMWNGVHIITKYDPEDKIGTTGQFIYDLNCIIDAHKRNFDVILQLGYTSSSVWRFLLPRKSLIVTNMDGLEWKRSKYSRNVRLFLLQAEKWAALHSDFLIADSIGIQRYLQKKYKRQSAYIAYGAELVTDTDEAILENMGLEKYGYNLVVARMEPENNIETIIKGHLKSTNSIPLVIVGSYKNSHGLLLQKKYRNTQIRFLGPIYDMESLNTLRYFSFYYIHGHSVGGTNPSLLEAMASRALIVAHNNIFNRSVLGDEAFYFKKAEDIVKILDHQIHRHDYDFMTQKNITKIETQYSWKHIINLLENYLLHAVATSNVERKQL